MQQKKAQGAFEFMILAGFVMIVIATIFIIIGDNVDAQNNEKRNDQIREIAISVQNEIMLASKSIDGYEREFKIQDEILGKDYSITIQDGMVQIITYDEKNAMALPVLNITGNIMKGTNIIKKDNGEVFLNE